MTDNERKDFQEMQKKIEHLINDFAAATEEQVVSYCKCDTELARTILASMAKRGRIVKNGAEYLSRKDIKENPNRIDEAIKVLWVYLDFRDQMDAGEYVFVDDVISLSFDAQGEIYDVIYVPIGRELSIANSMQMRERYLPEEARQDLHRIIIVDKEEQIQDIGKILGVDYYAVLDLFGNTKYIPANTEATE